MGEAVLIDTQVDATLKMDVERGSGVDGFEECFPKIMMRVLLVESDDSTRQIIAALLRKCNYKVAAISDGLKAWEILKQNHTSIDLILTEVDLPSISGFALLTLVKEHGDCRNIPVIMMSSSDSVSMVFKCMLKGAADFLIKPVRRNELQNLWQHVWRRNSANYGSSLQNLQGGDCKAEASSKNGATQNCSEDDVSSSKKRSRPSEEVSNNQVHSQMKHQRPSNLSSNEVHQDEKGMKLEKSPRMESSRVSQEDEAYGSTFRLEGVGSSSGGMARDKRIDHACCKSMDNIPNGELNDNARQAIDLIGTIDNHHERTIQQSISNCEMHNSSAAPHLELSLRRSDDPVNGRADGKQKLNHSNASSFSRYSTSKNLRTSFPTSDNNSYAEINRGGRFNENMVTSHDGSHKPVYAISSDEENQSTVMIGATLLPEPASPIPQVELAPFPGVGFRVTLPGDGPNFPLMFSPEASQENIGLKSTNQKESSPFFASTSLHSDQRTCSSLGCSGFDETSNNEEKVIYVDQQKYASGSASQSTNSTLCSGGFVPHLSQGNNNANQPMVSTDNAVDGDVWENGGNMLTNEQHPRASSALQNPQREAALAKFRQKRTERCYEKKVRYLSRKRLADQRPRVKGQFVRQVQMDQLYAGYNNRLDDGGSSLHDF